MESTTRAEVGAMSVPAPHKENPPAGAADPALRADARANRRRILEAARDTFLERGLDAPLAEVVRRSGVGAATLYRRFPTRRALVTEVFREQVETCVRVVTDAAADPDPWRAFCSVVEGLCDLDVVNRGFIRAFLSTYPERVDVDDDLLRAERAFADIVGRAHRAGVLRQDVGWDDLTLVLMANAGLDHHDPAQRLAASRRLASHFLRAFRR